MSTVWKGGLAAGRLDLGGDFPARRRVEIENADAAAFLPSRRAIAAPMPLAPPVTRTVRSFNPRIGRPLNICVRSRRSVPSPLEGEGVHRSAVVA